jgi:hypothetical protein
MNSKITQVVIITILLFIIVVCICFIGQIYWDAHHLKGVSQQVSVQPINHDLPEFDPAVFTNFPAVEKEVKMYADNQSIYKMNWNSLTEFNFDKKRVFVGWLQGLYSNGKTDDVKTPIFMVDGTLYYPNGWSATGYPEKETNWKTQYQWVEFNYYGPIQTLINSNTGYQKSEDKITKDISGVEMIRFNMAVDGTVTSANATINGKVYENVLPTQHYKDFVISTSPQNYATLDPRTQSEQNRKLPGNITATTSVLLDYGMKLVYPLVINRLHVQMVTRDSGIYDFYVGDQQYDPDEIHISCYPTPSDQVGPRSVELWPIAPASRALVKDWGYESSYHTDRFSFTGPHQYCTVMTSGLFRPDMISISL